MQLKKTNLQWIILIITLIIVASVTVVFYYYQHVTKFTYNKPEKTPTSQASIVPFEIGNKIVRNPQINIEHTVDQTKWIFYSGFSGFYFSYPPEWKAYETSPGDISVSSPDLENANGAPIHIYKTDIGYEDLINQFKSLYQNRKKSNLKSDNFSGIQFQGKKKISSGQIVPAIVSILKLSDTIIIVAEYIEYPGSKDYSDLYQQIIKTIRLQPATKAP